MAGPAPTEFLKFTEKDTEDLHGKAAANSTRSGYPASPSSVNPNDESKLEAIREGIGDVGHDLSHLATTVASDETAMNRLAKKSPISILRDKIFRKKAA